MNKHLIFFLIFVFILVFGVFGIIQMNTSLACKMGEQGNNWTYPINYDIGFTRVNFSCENGMEIAEGNFDYYGINKYAVGGILIAGFIMVGFMFREPSQKNEKKSEVGSK